MGNEQKNYVVIDFCKFFFAILIILLHTKPFREINAEFDFWFTQIVCRLAVPFFFIVSGFFVKDKMANGHKVFGYIKRLFVLYVLYFICYLPQTIMTWKVSGVQGKELIFFLGKYFLFVGSYYQLWYFLGLIVAVAILYCLVNICKLSIRTNFIIAICLYVIGVLGNTYNVLFMQIPVVGCILPIYYKLFDTTRNGVFFGLLFVMTGYYIRKCASSWKRSTCIIGLIIGMLLMHLEVYGVRAYIGANTMDMTFSLYLVSICLFMLLKTINFSQDNARLGCKLRVMSTLMFGWHMFIDYYLCAVFLLGFQKTLSSMVQAALTLVLTIVGAFVILQVSECRLFKWIKIFY